MKTLRCSQASRWIVVHLDEGLSPKRRELLEHHLRTCPACRRLNEQTAGIVAAVRRDMPADPGEAFWHRFDATLAAQLEEEDLRPRWLFPWKIAGSIAAAVLLLAAVFGSFMPQSPTYPTRPPSSRTVLLELYQVYSPLSLDSPSVVYGHDLSANGEGNRYVLDPSALLLFEVEDDPIQLFL